MEKIEKEAPPDEAEESPNFLRPPEKIMTPPAAEQGRTSPIIRLTRTIRDSLKEKNERRKLETAYKTLIEKIPFHPPDKLSSVPTATFSLKDGRKVIAQAIPGEILGRGQKVPPYISIIIQLPEELKERLTSELGVPNSISFSLTKEGIIKKRGLQILHYEGDKDPFNPESVRIEDKGLWAKRTVEEPSNVRQVAAQIVIDLAKDTTNFLTSDISIDPQFILYPLEKPIR